MRTGTRDLLVVIVIAYTRVDGYTQVMISCLAQLHKALADETRLRIMYLLLSVGDLCVCDLETSLDITQSKASRHLQTLKQAGLVADRRDATWVYYRVSEDLDDRTRSIVGTLRDTLGEDTQAQADAARARELRRSPRCGGPGDLSADDRPEANVDPQAIPRGGSPAFS